MNEIEEMTKRELNLDTNNIDEKWFILKLIKSDEDFEVLKLALGRLPVDWEDMTAEQKRNQLKNLLSDEDRRRVLSEEEINRGFANLSQADRDKLINRENGINKKIWGIDINKTKTAINDWYEQNTLLGALGHLGERRGEMVAELKRRLAGLQVKGERLEDQPRDIDRDEFERSGFLESIDYNAYHFVWSLAWSDYDIIRIYGREAAGKDDPMIKAVAYNQSSFMFFGRYTDHIWEFLTDELRGRWAGEREVNEIVRKMFPGKHHGLFDGNRTMVRFARFFGLDEEKKKSLGIIDRTDELMKENDFRHSDPEINKAFRDWAERIAIAEAIDTGKLSFGEVGFSKNAGEMKKYEMTDLFLDREFTVKYFWKDNFQAYLSDPSSERFLKINNKETIFYSGRNVRLWPWMTLALRAHWELGSKHTLRLFNKPNFTSANTESIVDNLVAEGSMERKQAEHEKKKLFGFSEIGSIHLGEFFGTLPFRRARQNMETMRRLGWDSKFLLFVALLAGFGAGLVEMSKQLPKQLSEGLTGTR